MLEIDKQILHPGNHFEESNGGFQSLLCNVLIAEYPIHRLVIAIKSQCDGYHTHCDNYHVRYFFIHLRLLKSAHNHHSVHQHKTGFLSPCGNLKAPRLDVSVISKTFCSLATRQDKMTSLLVAGTTSSLNSDLMCFYWNRGKLTQSLCQI